jgi:hypothetical protein
MMKKKKERDDWPGLVVPRNSTRGCSSDSKDGRPAVLLTTGSFNPITRAHVEILEIAKRAVEKVSLKMYTRRTTNLTHTTT